MTKCRTIKKRRKKASKNWKDGKRSSYAIKKGFAKETPFSIDKENLSE